MNRAEARTDALPGLSDAQIEQVRLQVKRILEHALFVDTTRMKRFLTYVVEETLAGRGARLKGYSIALEVFDKTSDFDPQSDTIVRVQASQLRRRLDLYYAEDGQKDPVRLTIPKGRYAPRFEFRDTPAVPMQASNDSDATWPDAPILSGRPGVAVVTLEDHSDGGVVSFFAKGLTAEIVSALVQFRHIRIVAQHPQDGADQVAAALPTVDLQKDVQFVLSGNVRKSGDVVRVVVTLSALETGQVLYRDTFDRIYSLDTLFELQESIASNVAAAVAAPYGQINRHNRRLNSGRRRSLPAYEAVLRFYEMGVSPRQEKARELLDDIEAITRDAPDFSTGFAIQSMLHCFMCTQCIPPGDPDHHLTQARGLAQKSMSIDPMNSLAYFASFKALHHSGEIAAGSDMAKRAMTLNPNDYAMLAYFATTRALMGDMQTAEAYDRSARHLVSNPPALFDMAGLVSLLYQGDYEAVCRGTRSVDAESSAGLILIKSAALGLSERTEEGRRFLRSVTDDIETYLQQALILLECWQVDQVIRDVMVTGWSSLGLEYP